MEGEKRGDRERRRLALDWRDVSPLFLHRHFFRSPPPSFFFLCLAILLSTHPRPHPRGEEGGGEIVVAPKYSAFPLFALFLLTAHKFLVVSSFVCFAIRPKLKFTSSAPVAQCMNRGVMLLYYSQHLTTLHLYDDDSEEGRRRRRKDRSLSRSSDEDSAVFAPCLSLPLIAHNANRVNGVESWMNQIGENDNVL